MIVNPLSVYQQLYAKSPPEKLMDPTKFCPVAQRLQVGCDQFMVGFAINGSGSIIPAGNNGDGQVLRLSQAFFKAKQGMIFSPIVGDVHMTNIHYINMFQLKDVIQRIQLNLLLYPAKISCFINGYVAQLTPG